MNNVLSAVCGEVGWNVAWQTTLALAAGLLASAICRRRPARADGILVAAVIAALVAPTGALAVRQLGWGLLAPPKPATATRSLPAAAEPQAVASIGLPGESPDWRTPASTPVPAAGVPIAADTSLPLAPRTNARSQSKSQPTSVVAPWRAWVPPFVAAVWLTFCLAALMRLAGAAWSARKLLAASHRMHNARLDRALARAAEQLKLDITPEARISAGVRCPVIWCWSPRPIVLLPTEFVSSSDESTWLGIFCHELAHWKRRDHLVSLAVELLCCVVPWQPLAWWAARRHAHLSEQSCDEWALACGLSAENYADCLLDLAPQRGAALALAALRNRGGLAARIRHILDLAQARPALGRSWTIGVAVSTFSIVALAALAQQKPLAAGDERPTHVAVSSQTAPTANPDSPSEPLQHVSGVVLDVSDKPVRGARVYWVGLVRPDLNHTLPRNDPRRDSLEFLAECLTDDRGQFAMSARFDPRAYHFPALVVRHGEHGLGLRSYLAEEAGPLRIHLPDVAPIAGRILDPSGMPVAGAAVLPVHLQALVRRPEKAAVNGEKAEDEDGWGWLNLPDAARRGGELPEFWPKAVRTDADGRFTIPRGDNCGTELLRITANGFGSHGVTVTDAQAVAEWTNNKPRGDQAPPLTYDFTLILEPPRTIEGVFTDAQTGKPVANVEIVLESNRDSGYIWNRQFARAISDEQGRYKFLTPATGREQHFHIYPPLGYAPLGGRIYHEREFAELFANSRVYQNNVQLKPGRIVRGRVVDADNGAPLADAAVVYRPAPGNPNLAGADYWFYEPVLTDDDGGFAVTAIAGKGLISVDTHSPEHIRSQVPPEIAGGRSGINPHAFEIIDLSDAGETPGPELAVHRGADLLVEPIGPDGKPVRVVQFAYREVGVPASHGLRSQRVSETPLRLRGCAPGQAYRLLIGTPNAELGAVADVKCDPVGGPVKISLHATGTIRGTLTYADGAPANDIHTFLHFDDDAPAPKNERGPLHNLPFYNNVMQYKPESRTVTDGSGEFEISGIVPGLYLYLSVNYEFASDEWPGGMIEPGKTLDLGKLVIKP